MIAEDTKIELRRNFRASPERVFEAWIDPVDVRQWLLAFPHKNAVSWKWLISIDRSYSYRQCYWYF